MWEELIQELSKELHPNQPIVVGISGGIDSVVLLHLLDRTNKPLIGVHLNFHLRGKESDRDETFVRRLFKEKYPHHFLEVVHADTFSYAKERGISLEMAAREIRYSHFHQVAKQSHASQIAVGHHLNDQVETFFINILRGTGGKGLVGMKRYDGQLFRPLLNKSREEIERYQQTYSLEFVMDSTNINTDIQRNAIRHRILPLFEKLKPTFVETLSKSMGIFAEEQTLLDKTIHAFWQERWNKKTQTLDLSQLSRDPDLPLKLFRFLQPFHFTDQQVRDLLRNIQRSGSYFISTDEQWRAELFRQKIYLIPLPLEIWSEVSLRDSSQEVHLETIGSISWQRTTANKTLSLQVASSLLHTDLTLRPARPNDRFKPLGMKCGSKSLFEYLKEQGVPAVYRPLCPVLTDGINILAVPPLQISEMAKVTLSKPVYITFTPSKHPLGSLLSLLHKPPVHFSYKEA